MPEQVLEVSEKRRRKKKSEVYLIVTDEALNQIFQSSNKGPMDASYQKDTSVWNICIPRLAF